MTIRTSVYNVNQPFDEPVSGRSLVVKWFDSASERQSANVDDLVERLTDALDRIDDLCALIDDLKADIRYLEETQ